MSLIINTLHPGMIQALYFSILCVFICVHFIIELTKIIVDKHIEISLRKKSLVLLIGMILVMFYSFIIDVLTWYQPIFIISFIIALSNWNIKEAQERVRVYKIIDGLAQVFSVAFLMTRL